MSKFQRHVFVCTNHRDGSERESCAPRGGAEVAEAFKKTLFARGLKRVVRPNKAGCLDQCAMGVVCVVYPEGVWYRGVTPADVDEIVESHILGGRPVERLRLPESELTGREPDADNAPQPLCEDR